MLLMLLLVELPVDVLPPIEFPFMAGVAVLIGVAVVFVVLVVFVVVVFALFAFSLPQPMPRAATASKVRRAKVLRIELSPVTQRVRLLGSWAEESSQCALECFRFSSVNCLSHMRSVLRNREVCQRINTRGRLIIHYRLCPP